MKKDRFSRREFLQTTAGAAGATLAANAILLNSEPLFASTPPVAASDRVRFGIVGVGMEGSNLLTTAIQLPGVECAAACDVGLPPCVYGEPADSHSVRDDETRTKYHLVELCG